jgi:hypothetical protein
VVPGQLLQDPRFTCRLSAVTMTTITIIAYVFFNNADNKGLTQSVYLIVGTLPELGVIGKSTYAHDLGVGAKGKDAAIRAEGHGPHSLSIFQLSHADKLTSCIILLPPPCLYIPHN